MVKCADLFVTVTETKTDVRAFHVTGQHFVTIFLHLFRKPKVFPY